MDILSSCKVHVLVFFFQIKKKFKMKLFFFPLARKRERAIEQLNIVRHSQNQKPEWVSSKAIALRRIYLWYFKNLQSMNLCIFVYFFGFFIFFSFYKPYFWTLSHIFLNLCANLNLHYTYIHILVLSGTFFLFFSEKVI